jgi:arabinogalactan oligomer / maltooligosaccharide transport system permease protein
MRWFALLLLASTAAAAEPLKLWHAYRGAEESALEHAVAEFTQESGVQVELLAVPYDAFSSKITSAIPHDAGPDVFLFAHERLRQFHRLGVVAQASGLERERYLGPALGALELEGAVWGYPLSLKCLALFYDRAAVPTPPATTAELIEKARALAKPAENRFGFAYEAGDFYYHAPILMGFGGKLFADDGHAIFDTPEQTASLKWVLALQEQQLMPREISGALVKTLFNDRRVPMVISGPWFSGEIDPKVDYAVARLPVNSETGQPLRPFLGVEAAYVSARARQPEQAQALAKFLSQGKASLIRTKEGRQIPADLAAYDDPEVAADRLISAFKSAAANAMPTPNTLEMARVWEPMKLALRGVLQGVTLPEDGGKLAERRYRALFRESPPEASPWPYVGALGLALAAGVAFSLSKRSKDSFSKRFPDTWRGLLYVAPAAAGVLVLIVVPLVVGIVLAFMHHDAGKYTFVGLGNFRDLLSSKGYSITEPLSFWFTLAVTVLWTAANVVLHVGIGLALALMLKSPLLKLRGLWRVLLIVPWAVPNYITALMWKGMFHSQFGAINGVLAALGIEPVSWFTRFSTAFAANLATNTWIGFPFMMVVALGALQSIPADLYEAAEVDGASKWAQFRHITLPLLRPALLPAVTLGTVWTFNMFNIVYLVSGGEPGGATDILVSEAYRWAFQRNEQYGFAAAYCVMIFFVLLLWSRLTTKSGAEPA